MLAISPRRFWTVRTISWTMWIFSISPLFSSCGSSSRHSHFHYFNLCQLLSFQSSGFDWSAMAWDSEQSPKKLPKPAVRPRGQQRWAGGQTRRKASTLKGKCDASAWIPFHHPLHHHLCPCYPRNTARTFNWVSFSQHIDRYITHTRKHHPIS